MKRLALLLPVVVLGCGSTSEGSTHATAQSVDLANPPQSALTALVRSLEVVDAIQAPGGDIRVRAIECDSMVDRDNQQEFVRVVLDVTVLAPRYEEAERVFAELTAALETEGASATRSSSAARGRVERVFQSMDWSTRDLPESSFRRLVSISDSIRVEVRVEGNGIPSGESSYDQPFEGAQAVGEYIQSAADDEHVVIGPVQTKVSVYRPRAGSRDLRYRIRPEDPRSPYSREQIGTFLYLLEAGSPATKVTHVTIAPYEPGSDVEQDLWTFKADVSVRTPDI
jgi:hypothetical protein